MCDTYMSNIRGIGITKDKVHQGYAIYRMVNNKFLFKKESNGRTTITITTIY